MWWNHTAMTKSPRLTGLEASWARAGCRWQMKQSTTVVVGSNFQLLTSCSISKISIGSSEQLWLLLSLKLSNDCTTLRLSYGFGFRMFIITTH